LSGFTLENSDEAEFEGVPRGRGLSGLEAIGRLERLMTEGSMWEVVVVVPVLGDGVSHFVLFLSRI
jgi:hypothetical protein